MKVREAIGDGSVLITDGLLKYLQFECFEEYAHHLVHCFSTRIGGTSSGECLSLNLGFNRNDDRKNVIANFRKLCGSIGIDSNNLVFSNQVHDNRIRIVTEEDKGKGFCRESDIIGFDGLVTNCPGVPLVTFYADCVPLFFYDHTKKVAALAHSGWRSTVKNIAAEMVIKMACDFGCSTESIIVAIGPSIGKCCFEVGEEVYVIFKEKYDNNGFYRDISGGKWKIDLQGIIENELKRCGILQKNIHRSNICTKCRNELFFSYRGDSARTGSLAGIIQLK